jgi:ComF family protein
MRIINYLAGLKTTLLNKSLLQSCFLCGTASQESLCIDCLADLPYQKIVCQCCGRMLAVSGFCGDCQGRLPMYRRLQSVFTYDYPVNKLIQTAKYHSNLAILVLLGKLMAQHLCFSPRPDILIPVPLHINRLRYRGYNQSLELARCISKHIGIPLDYMSCVRVKNTPPQVNLSAKSRRMNVKGAFQVMGKCTQWEHIGIIDDVVTTGSTVEELTSVLLRSGAKRVDVWCCARHAI